MIKFEASKVTVLRFTNNADKQGQVFPADCHAVIPEGTVPVTFNHQGKPVGKAKLRRLGNKIVADIEVASVMPNTLEAIRLLRLLTPSIEAEILDAYQNQILGIKIVGLALCSGTNADPKIKPLGDAVRCATPSTNSGLH